MKKFISFTLIFSLFSFMCTTALATDFQDVKPDAWYYQSISDMSSRGIINGTGNNMFEPNNNITGAAFTTMLTRAFYNEETEKSIKKNTESHWAAPYISVAQQLDLLNNIDLSYDSITRADVAQMLYNMVIQKKLTLPSEENLQAIHITDIDNLDSTLQQRIKTVCALGLLSGYEDNSFKGSANLTRAEAAKLMSNIFKNFPNINSDNPNQLTVSISTSKAGAFVGSSYNISYSLAAKAGGGAGNYKYKFEIIENNRVTESHNWSSNNCISGSLRGNGSCIIKVSVKDADGEITTSEVDMLK